MKRQIAQVANEQIRRWVHLDRDSVPRQLSTQDSLQLDDGFRFRFGLDPQQRAATLVEGRIGEILPQAGDLAPFDTAALWPADSRVSWKAALVQLFDVEQILANELAGFV